ncbi:MAG: M48 family metallopeptidase [Opitutia bacterium]
MDFFGAQEKARGRTTLLVVLLVLALASLVGALYALAVVGLRGGAGWWHPDLLATTSLVAGGSILVGGLIRHQALRQGGSAVAASLGGRRIARGGASPEEARYLNVVEEMALASGTPVPACFVLDGEPGINAFAAGNTPSDAAVAVTRGALEQLSREELQGVVAHEFSHIANGDVRLNLRLVAVVAGLVTLTQLGYLVVRLVGNTSGSRRDKDGGARLALLAAGLAIMAAGFGGRFFARLIQASISRQREFLADAAAVQYTRNPLGLAGVFRKLAREGARAAASGGGSSRGLAAAGQADVQHMLFAEAPSLWVSLMATHPPLQERLRRLDPGATLTEGARRSPASQEAASDAVGLAGSAPPPLPAAADRPSDGAIQDAVGFRGALPPQLRAAAAEPVGALGLLFGLTLSVHGADRERQLAVIRRLVEGEVEREILRIAPQVAALPEGHRIPLLDLAMPALRELTSGQRAQVLAALDETGVAASDGLMGLLLRASARRHLSPEDPPGLRVPSAQEADAHRRLVLSAVVAMSRQDPPGRLRSHAAACRLLGVDPGSGPAESPDLAVVASSLGALRGLPVPARRDIVRACGVAMLSDGRAEPREAEIVRAVADLLGISFAIAPPR